METVEIRSIVRDIALQLSDPQKNGEFVTITIQLSGRDVTHLTVTVPLSAPEKLVQFFTRLAAERPEWGEERRWETDRRDFALAAGVDRPGRVNLSATIRAGRRFDDPNATTTLVLENGDLKGIAGEVKALLSI